MACKGRTCRGRLSSSGGMRRLSQPEANALVAKARKASEAGMHGDKQAWNEYFDWARSIPAEVHFPTGELLNPDIRGFVIAWRMKGEIGSPQPITARDSFNAQGLEGKIVLPLGTLGDAVLVAVSMKPGRYNIWVPKGVEL